MSKATWFLVFLFPLLFIGFQRQEKLPLISDQIDRSGNPLSINYQAPNPTLSPSYPIETPEPRLLPAVGGNAGLVIGASILVIIIIGGVIYNSRKKGKG